jgi:hypothetical protein
LILIIQIINNGDEVLDIDYAEVFGNHIVICIDPNSTDTWLGCMCNQSEKDKYSNEPYQTPLKWKKSV